MARAIALMLSVAVGACVADLEQDQLDTTELPQLHLNQLHLNQLMLNALLGNADALDGLSEQALHSETFDPDSGDPWLSQQLLDPTALDVMHYLVGCALDDTMSVSWTHPDTETVHTFTGSAGLCPDWHHGAPSQDCLEIVSACLLARNNAFGTVVTTSQRGADADDLALPLAPEVNVTPVSENGVPIASFEPCTEPETGAARSCGFDPEQSFVGMCEPGSPYSAWVYCSQASDDVSVRVCEGIAGCEPDSSLVLGKSDAVCSAPIAFSCPASGRFAVMTGPQDTTMKQTADLKGWNAAYPASERDVFTVPEGAFYGNLFDSGMRAPDMDVYVDHDGDLHVPPTFTAGPIFKDMWACNDAGFTAGVAFMKKRVCAQAKDALGQYHELCAATPVGDCNQQPWNTPSNTCGHLDGWPVLGDGDFDNCRDGNGDVRQFPITVYLTDGCDTLPSRLHRYCGRQ